ncbi:MAG: hypothetical protein ACTSRG_25805, partial [Candidatus Helarchaeota archaeon]
MSFLIHNKPFLAGFVLNGDDQFWENRFQKLSSICQVSKDGYYKVRIFNGNWDTKICNSKGILGLQDGIPFNDDTGFVYKNIPAGVKLTSGIAAYWDIKNKALTLIASPSSSRKIFFRKINNGVAFSSDMRFLIKGDEHIDTMGLTQLIAYGSSEAGHTIFSEIKMIGFLMAGRFIFKGKHLFHEIIPVIKYKPEHSMGQSMEEESFIQDIHRSLARTLTCISKHRIALLLSGGVDSTLIAYILKEIGAK